MSRIAKSQALRKTAFFLLRMSGIPFLLRELAQRRRATILVYHKLPPEIAGRHFPVLRRKYNIITLADYMSWRDGGITLPPKPLVITFDDGHKGNYLLKPLFEKHGIRATTFLCSGLVGTDRHFWFETAMREELRQSLKRVTDDERVEILASLGFSETAERSTRQALSAGEIEAMKPVVDFQSHTVYHPLLPQCSTSRSLVEIATSKTELEEKFRLSIYALAYPNGDYSAREIAAAQASGYRCALTLDAGFNSRTTPPFQLRRICISDDADIDELLVKASGLWGFLKSARRSLAKMRSQGPEPDYRADLRGVSR